MSLEDEFLFTAHSGKRKALDKFLKKHGSKVDVNCSSNDGATPLIQCVQGSRMAKENASKEYVQCCKRLITAGADVNRQDQLGRTPLHWSVFYNKADVAAELLNSEADTAIQDDGGQNVFHFAVRVHALECLQALCDQADIEALEEPNDKGVPPIVYAIQQGHLDSCEVLVSTGVDVNKREENDAGKTALHCAIESNRLDLVEFLLSHEARVDIIDANNLTAVDLSCMCQDANHLETIIRHLKDKKMNTLSVPNERGITPLMIACQKGNNDQVKLLIKEGVPIDTRCNKGKTALHYTVENKDANCTEALLEADSKIADIRDNDGHTALHLATIGANKVVISVLIKYADINGTDQEKHTPIHWATVCGHGELIEFLIQNGANASLPDVHDAYPMHYAAQMCGDPQIQHIGIRCLKSLVKSGVAIDCKDNNGRQPLLWAASAGSSAACVMLCNAGADVHAVDKDRLTALHCAASRGHVVCVQTLIMDCQCDVDFTDKNGCSALFYAITLGHTKCVAMLLDFNASTKLQDIKGRSPAHCAASKGNISCLKLLGNVKAPLDMANSNGNHPIHEAIHKGHQDVVQYLLEFGCNPNATNKAGMAALHQAAVGNHETICRMLVDAGAKIDILMKNEQKYVTPLDLAIDKGSKESVEYLRSIGAKRGSQIINDAAIVITRNVKRLFKKEEPKEKDDAKTPGDAEDKKEVEKGKTERKTEIKKRTSKAPQMQKTESDKLAENNEKDDVSEISLKEDDEHANKKQSTEKKVVRKSKSPYLAPQPWLDKKSSKGSTPRNVGKKEEVSTENQESDSKQVKDNSIQMNGTTNSQDDNENYVEKSRPVNMPSTPRGTSSRNYSGMTRNYGQRGTPMSAQSYYSGSPGRRKGKRFPQGADSDDRQKELADIYQQNSLQNGVKGRNGNLSRGNAIMMRSGSRSARSHRQVPPPQQQIDPELVVKDIEQKMTNWDKYLEEELSFLDDIIKSNHPAIDDFHDEAEQYKAELARHLNELKQQVDDNTKKLENELKNDAENDKEKKNKQEVLIKDGIVKAEETYRKVSSGAKNTMIKSQQENDKQEEELSRASMLKRPTLEQWLRRKTMDYDDSPRTNDDDYEDLEDVEELRKNKHEEWMKKKNDEYKKKKQSVRANSVRNYSVKSIKLTRPATSLKKERTRPDWRPMSQQQNRSTSTPTMPRYTKSPFSNRTTSECPHYRRSHTPSATRSLPLRYSSAQIRLMRGSTSNSIETRPSTSSITHEETFDLRPTTDSDGKLNKHPQNGMVYTSHQHGHPGKDKKQQQKSFPQATPWSQLSSPSPKPLSPRQSSLSSDSIQ